MSKIIDLAAHRYDPHREGPAECVHCGHAWMAVAPVGTEVLDCPACGLETGVFSGLVMRDGPEWHCGCGNAFFRIAAEGIYCPVCGAWQQWT